MALVKALISLYPLIAIALGKAPPNVPPSGGSLSITPLPGDLVVNGGFESGSFSGWTPSGSDQGVETSSHINTGTHGAYLGTATSTGSLSQVITVQPSTTYVIQFYYYSDGATPNSFTFKLNGDVKLTVTDDSDHDFSSQVFAFTTPPGGSPTATLEFDVQNDNGYFFLDDVSLIKLPVPCSSDLYSFSSSTGAVDVVPGKSLPNPPHGDTPFPYFDSQGQLVFKYVSDLITATFPRVMQFGLAPSSVSSFSDTLTACRWTKPQANSCPSSGDVLVAFSLDVPGAFSESLDTLSGKNCIQRSVSPDGTTATFSGFVMTLYQDPYNTGDHWASIDPIQFSIIAPSSLVTVGYQPVEVINLGGSIALQLTSITTSLYPYVAYGTGTKYTPPSGSSTSATESNVVSYCVLYNAPGQVSTDTSYCNSHPATCVVECTRRAQITEPQCDMTGFNWELDFATYRDYQNPPALATHLVSDPAWSSFSTAFSLENSASTWQTCPSVDSTDYTPFVVTDSIQGHYDSTTGNAVTDPSTPVLFNSLLSFGFKVSLEDPGSPPPHKPSSSSGTKIYLATLTQLKVTRPDNTVFYLVGTDSDPTTGGPADGQNRVSNLVLTPSPLQATPNVYSMAISPQASDGDLKFATIQVAFTPNLGLESGQSMIYYSDGSTYPDGVELTVSFTCVISLFADSAAQSMRRRTFVRDQTVSSNATVFGSRNHTVVLLEPLLSHHSNDGKGLPMWTLCIPLLACFSCFVYVDHGDSRGYEAYGPLTDRDEFMDIP